MRASPERKWWKVSWTMRKRSPSPVSSIASTASALKRSELVAKPSGSTRPTMLGFGQDRRQRAQGLAQTVQPFLVREAIGDVVDRAEHQRRRAAALRIAGEPGGLARPLLVPVVEALQRVDRDDAHARGLGLLADARRRRAVADRHAVKIVADLDLVEPERGRELDSSAKVLRGATMWLMA